MKCVISFSFLLLLSPIYLMAQKQFGVKAGVNVGNVAEQIEFSNDNTISFIEQTYKIKANPQLGIWMDLPLTSRLSLQPEILWTQKHFHADDEISNPTDGYVNFHYFSLPILAKYRIGKWRIELGPEISFLMDQSLADFNSPLREHPFIEENEFEFAANLGLQYTFRRWIVGLRASRDVTEFLQFDFTDFNGEPFGDLKNFHQNCTLWVAYQVL